MITVTTWKARPLSPEQTGRMMAAWGTQQAQDAADPAWEQIFWGIFADGSGGLQIGRATDIDKANARGLEQCLVLGEFLELETKVALEMEHAMPAILAAVGSISGG